MKKNNKKNNNIILIALVILFVILAILFIVQYILEKTSNVDPVEKAKQDYGYETMGVYKDPQVEAELESVKNLQYENIMILRELKGELPTSTVVNKVKKAFVEAIPEVLEETEDMSEQELIKYYTDNEFDIQNDIRIDNQKSFLNMISKFKTLTCDVSKDYDTCRFSEGDTLTLTLSYENGETIECKILGEIANTIIFEF